MLAIFFQLTAFHFPLTPIPFKIDVSAILELLSAIAYGPVAGIGVTLIKNVIYILILRNSLATILPNVILDCTFVVVSSVVYTNAMHKFERTKNNGVKNKHVRLKKILMSGFIAAVITSLMSYFAVNYIMFPLAMKLYSGYGYTEQYFLTCYNNSLQAVNSYLPQSIGGKVTEIKTLSQGSLVYNVPINFYKLVGVTVFDALVYKWLSPYLHYRKRKKKTKKAR